MTEKQWLTSSNKSEMWRFVVQERLSERKMRLFGSAFCGVLRRESARFTDGVEFENAAELVADGRLTLEAARESVRSHPGGDAGFFCGLLAKDLGNQAFGGFDWMLVMSAMFEIDDIPPTPSSLLREIFGNPFRPVAIDSASLTPTVVALATGIYDEKAFDRTPILADALQDAGCDHNELLNHLRDPDATHVRGCWALDLVLGKA